MERRGTLSTGIGAAFALGAIAFAMSQALDTPVAPMHTYRTDIPLPKVGSTMRVPKGTTSVLVLPSCGSCSLRALAPDLVSKVSKREEFLLLQPDPESALPLHGAKARVRTGREAVNHGPWTSLGPVLVSLDGDGKVRSVSADPTTVTLSLKALP